MMISLLGAGLTGVQQNLQRFHEHTDRISAWGDGSAVDDPAADVAGLLSARSGVEANLAVLHAGDRLLGSLIDILA